MASPTTTDGLKVVFIGMNHEYSLAPLRALAERCNVVGAIESIHPDWDYRNGSWLKRIARRRSIPYCSMDRKNRPIEFLQTTRPDAICVAGMAQLLRREEWEIAHLGAINLHPSLLPNYRGPQPLFWQAQRMDLEGGVSVIRIDEGFDTGDILGQERIRVSPGEPTDQLLERTIQVGIELLLRCLEQLAAGELQSRRQRYLPCPFHARPLRREDWDIDWEGWPIERVWHFLRAAPSRNPTVPPPPGKGQWAIGTMVRTHPAGPPGSCGSDDRGPFLCHPQGKIRLDPVKEAPFAHRILRRIRRHLASP